MTMIKVIEDQLQNVLDSVLMSHDAKTQQNQASFQVNDFVFPFIGDIARYFTEVQSIDLIVSRTVAIINLGHILMLNRYIAKELGNILACKLVPNVGVDDALYNVARGNYYY